MFFPEKKKFKRTLELMLYKIGASIEEKRSITDPRPACESRVEGFEPEKKSHVSHRLARGIKRTAKASIGALHKLDNIKDQAMSLPHERSSDVLGIPTDHTGPIRFPAEFKGKPGHAYVVTTTLNPMLSWNDDEENTNLAWTVHIESLSEVMKVSRLGQKRRVMVEWLMDHQVEAGLRIRTNNGESFDLTNIEGRDELFNRLVSIGGQTWESW